MAYTCIHDKAGDFQYDNKETDDTVSTGRFTITFRSAHNVSHPGDRSDNVNWLNKRKDNLKIYVNSNFKVVMAKNMTENRFHKGFAINGFTKCKLKHNNEYVVYHANSNVYGEEWYDFCMVDFDDDMCLARIHGFLQYKTSGLPTNVLLGDGKSVEEIAASLYVCCHTYSEKS